MRGHLDPAMLTLAPEIKQDNRNQYILSFGSLKSQWSGSESCTIHNNCMHAFIWGAFVYHPCFDQLTRHDKGITLEHTISNVSHCLHHSGWLRSRPINLDRIIFPTCRSHLPSTHAPPPSKPLIPTILSQGWSDMGTRRAIIALSRLIPTIIC